MRADKELIGFGSQQRNDLSKWNQQPDLHSLEIVGLWTE
jgi:hypothetical protein